MPIKAPVRSTVSASVLLAAVIVLLAGPQLAQADETAGHALAEKFSAASEEERRKAEEAARREQEAWAAAQAQTEAEAKAREAAQARDEAERLAAETVEIIEKARAEAAAREAEQRRAAEEKAAAEAVARAEEEAHRAADVRREVEEQLARNAEHQREEEARRAAGVRRQVEEQLAREAEQQREEEERAAVEAHRAALEAEREAEAHRLSTKIKRAQERRSEQQTTGEKAAEAPLPAPDHSLGGPEQPTVEQTQDTPAATEVVAGPSPDPGADRARVTVLLILEPGSRGIRRFGKTADPVLCVGALCYIGRGAERAATAMPRLRAFGTINTLGQRAGDCRRSLRCIYRTIDLAADSALMQPVDLKILRHDRREQVSVHPDASCAVDAGRLTCQATVRTRTWRAWVVPEAVAREAGPDALKSALAEGLPEARTAQIHDTGAR